MLVRLNALVASSCSYLYESIVSSIIKTIPRTLFPVFRRGLGLLTFCSLTSFKPWRALRARWSHRSTVSLDPISSTEPGHSGDSWYTVNYTKGLDLQS